MDIKEEWTYAGLPSLGYFILVKCFPEAPLHDDHINQIIGLQIDLCYGRKFFVVSRGGWILMVEI